MQISSEFSNFKMRSGSVKIFVRYFQYQHFKYIIVITPNFVCVSKMATFNFLFKIIYYDWSVRALMYYTYFSKD